MTVQGTIITLGVSVFGSQKGSAIEVDQAPYMIAITTTSNKANDARMIAKVLA